MADLKITELTALTTPNDADLFCIVDDVSGTATTKKITLANSLKGIDITTSMGVQGAVATPGILLLSTLETTVVDGDKLGQINFQAPSEASGTDAILVSGSIWAEADGTFAVDANATSLVFATGTTATAAEVMRVNNTGMTITAGLTTAGAVLNLSTNEPSVVDGDVLGQIDFQAPLETGTDAIVVAASISAEADAAFDATTNTTSLVFATGTTSTPIERVRIGNTVGITVAANTTGISIGATTTAGLAFTGALVTGITFSGATLAPGSAGGTSDRAIEVGSRATELTLAFAGSDGIENFEPIQMKVDVTGTNPASLSKINMIYQQLTHDTTAMANLRLKCADFTISVNEACKDVYAYQGEIAFGAGTFTVGGEVATIGLVLDGGSGTITASGGWRVLNLTARGAGLPTNASGLYIQCESSCTLTDGIRIQTQATGTITNAILFGNTSGTSNTCPTNMFKVPAIASGFVSAYTTEEAPTGKLQIQVGGDTRYIAFWD